MPKTTIQVYLTHARAAYKALCERHDRLINDLANQGERLPYRVDPAKTVAKAKELTSCAEAKDALEVLLAPHGGTME